MSAFDSAPIWELLEGEGIDLVVIAAWKAERGEALNLEDDAALLAGVQLLGQLLTQERYAATFLAGTHDDLRLKYAEAMGRLDRAHKVVSRKAVEHHDSALAALARDEVYGQPRRETLDRQATGEKVLRMARAFGAKS